MLPLRLFKRKSTSKKLLDLIDWYDPCASGYYGYKPDYKKRPASGEYTGFPQDGYILTVREYYGLVQNGKLIPQDGYGHPVRNNRLDSKIDISPERYGEDIPRDATHIEWYPD